MELNRYWILLILLILATGCSGDDDRITQNAAHESTPIAQDLLAQLPPIPLDESRESSIIIVEGKPGAETFNSDESTQIAGSTLNLVSQDASLSWAIWQLNPGSGVPDSFEVQMSTDGDGVAYFAVADYVDQRWTFIDPSGDGFVSPLDALRCQSPSGNIYVAGMTYGGDVAHIDSIHLYFENGWTTTTVSESVGAVHSLCLVGGLPTIAYSQADGVKYVRAESAPGTAWAEPALISSSPDEDTWPILAEISGLPAVTFLVEERLPPDWDIVSTDIMYARASDVVGTSWNLQLLDTIGEHRYYTMSIVNGNPAYVITERTKNPDESYSYAAMFHRASEPTGEAAWSSAVSLGDWDIVYPSLKVDNGLPIISCRTRPDALSPFGVYVKGATDAAGTSWNPYAPVDLTATSGDLSGEIVAGGMSIAYYYAAESNLRFTWYSYQAEDWLNVTIDPATDVGRNPSLAVVDGNPAISYFDATNGDLRFAYANDAKGQSWSTPLVVDSAGFVGEYSCLIDVAGKPAISYYDATNQSINYAYYSGI